MKSIVYILQSNNGKYYIGSTNNIERRLEQHARGHTSTTKRLGNCQLVFSQGFDSLDKARQIEKQLKKWKRKDFIEKIIRDGKILKID